MTETEVPLDFPLKDGLACPYPAYESMRRRAPVFKVPSRDEYIVTSFAEVEHALRHPEIFSSARHTVGMRESGFVGVDPPDHRPRRDVAYRMVKPGRIRTYEAMVRQTADELIDAFIDRGECEFVAEFSGPLPILSILAIFGFPREDMKHYVRFASMDGVGIQYRPKEEIAEARRISEDLFDYVRGVVVDRHDNPRDNGVSEMVQAHAALFGQLDLGKATADVANMLAGGMVTTAHLIATAMLMLLRNPDLLAAVGADPARIPTMIEEALRMDAPVQYVPRWTTRATELGGVTIPEGAQVNLLIGAADRDPAVFDRPDDPRLDRPNQNDHLAFGQGIHFCIGAPLARLEARVAFEQIFARMADIRLDEVRSDVRNIDSLTFRGPRRLVLTFQRRS